MTLLQDTLQQTPEEEKNERLSRGVWCPQGMLCAWGAEQ